eukprot:scaffold130217_cov63-Phaeocystis_antarctica.AAC.1
MRGAAQAQSRASQAGRAAASGATGGRHFTCWATIPTAPRARRPRARKPRGLMAARGQPRQSTSSSESVGRGTHGERADEQQRLGGQGHGGQCRGALEGELVRRGARVLRRHLGVVGKGVDLLALVGLDLLDEIEHEQPEEHLHCSGQHQHHARGRDPARPLADLELEGASHRCGSCE